MANKVLQTKKSQHVKVISPQIWVQDTALGQCLARKAPQVLYWSLT